MQPQQLTLLGMPAIPPAVLADATPKAIRPKPTAAPTIVSAPAAPVVEEPPAPPSLNDVFKRYLDAMAEMGQIIQKQQEFEKSLFGRSFTQTPSTQHVPDIAKSALQCLIYKAEQAFAPSGGKLSISLNRMLEETGLEDWDDNYRTRVYRRGDGKEKVPMELDLDKLWAHIEKTYGGEAGEIEGYRQQAAKLIKRFRLEDNPEVRRTSSGVILTARIYSQIKDYGSNKGLYEVYHGYQENIRDIMGSLRCFAEKEGLDALAIALQPSHTGMENWDFAFALRQKSSFPGLDISHFKEKWEFKFAHEVAEKLMLFIGEFGST